jgi:galactose mutarotase-like enzyme
MNYVLKNEYYEATFASRGAEMISLKNSRGRELLWQNNTGKGWSDHAPILFPLCGNIKDKKAFYKGEAYAVTQHGFALRSEFELIKKSETEIVFELISNAETKAQYPFDFKFTVAYSLKGEKIVFRANVENTGADVLPYSFGWHPGFMLPTEDGQDIEDYAIKFDNKKEVTWVHFYSDFDTPNDYSPYPTPKSEYKLCEKEIYENDTMIFLGAGSKVALEAEGHPYRLTLSWTKNIPVLCLWKAANHDSKFICIEPWTHDTIRGERSNYWEEREAHRLAPGKSEVFEYTLKIEF